ncbi:MAG: elongation factor 1-beta [Nanoarchaeota archaeon]
MAQVIITLKIMPESPETALDTVAEAATKLIADFGGEVGKTEEEPIAFGLKALNLTFVMDEAKGSTDDLEASINALDGVNSCEATDVRRALG